MSKWLHAGTPEKPREGGRGAWSRPPTERRAVCPRTGTPVGSDCALTGDRSEAGPA